MSDLRACAAHAHFVPECTACNLNRKFQEVEVKMFMCGPVMCAHDYSGPTVEVKSVFGEVEGGTAVCSKCGIRAIDEAIWG